VRDNRHAAQGQVTIDGAAALAIAQNKDAIARIEQCRHGA
jgi:hypothetical protein